MRSILLRSALLLFCCRSFSAYGLDLMHAYDYALGNDPVFRSITKDFEAAEANRSIGRSALLPQVTGNITEAGNKSNINGPLYLNGPWVTTTRTYPSSGVSAQISQPLFNLAALASMRQGVAQAEQGRAKFLSGTHDLLVRVTQAYTDLLYAQDNARYLTAQRDAYKEQLEVNNRLFQGGEGIVTDALETRASYELSVAQVIEARDQIQEAKGKLEAILGFELTSLDLIKKLKRSFGFEAVVPADFASWRQLALDNNAELRASNSNVQVARQQYEGQKAGHMPTLSAVVSWGQSNGQTIQSISQNSITTTAGIQLSIPFYSGGRTQGLMVQSYANYEKAQADRDVIQNRILIDLRKQFDLTVSSRQRIEALNRSVESAQELTKAMRKSVIGGQRINLDVLVSDKGLATAQRDLAQAKYGYLLAILRLRQLAGTLSEDDLSRVANFFERDR